MKALIILSLVVFATAATLPSPWPEVSIDNPASPSDSYSESDPTDEFTTSDESDTLGICWMNTYGRVAQQPINPCDDGLVAIGVFCYDACPENYTAGYSGGLASQVDMDPESSEESSDVESFCWENCPAGYESDTDDSDQCNQINGNNVLPQKSFNRTFVDTLECASGLELVSSQCYEPAQQGYMCQGSLCYGQCPHSWYLCGALCVKTSQLCVGNVIDEGFGVNEALQNMASALTDPSQGASVSAMNVPNVVGGPVYPWCE
jgi:hypothetical protein